MTLLASAALLLSTCNPPAPEPADVPDTPDKPDTPVTISTPSFARGADVSWLPEMEADGKVFKKADGATADLFTVLKDCGINSIRLRVWVNPTGGWSGKARVVELAGRATEAGMAVMVDFHYSDFFADPSRQTAPSAWAADLGKLAKMKEHVSAHTTEVLEALKQAGVSPAWIQIGNETRNGMLWPLGQLWTEKGDTPDGWSNFVALFNSGYDAAKGVFPNALVMPHLDNAWEDNAWWVERFRQLGGKMDMIALSHYPMAGDAKTATEYNNLALSNIRSLQTTFNVPVIVSETGVRLSRWNGSANVDCEAEAASLLKSFVIACLGISGCKGVFYWEPEVYGGWKPAVYTTLGWGPYDMGAFRPDGRASTVMDAFK